MQPVIQALLEKKSVTPEMGEGKRIDELNAYIDETLERLKAEIDLLPAENKTDWGRLNELFVGIVGN
jgi:predicted nucleotidyltransferase